MKIHARTMTLAALFAVLTAVGAYIRIPFPLVPMTLQTLFVFLSGALLGPRAGALSQILYVGMGFLGLPVFTGGGGPQYLLHPTIGFILGFIAGAWVVGRTLDALGRVSFLTCLCACFLGIAVIYALGAAGLYFHLNVVAGKDTSFWTVLEIGVIPFIAADGIKAVAVAAMAARIAPSLKRLKAGR
jgi:biotin transport system substrate-specific component